MLEVTFPINLKLIKTYQRMEPNITAKYTTGTYQNIESGVLRTTGNIGTSLSSSILREVWAKPIIFIRTLLGASFTIFHVEGKGNNIGV